MRITQQYESDGVRIELEPQPRTGFRLAMVALGAAAATVGWVILPLGYKAWVVFGMAAVALALGLGRSVYSIRPGKDVRFRQLILGFPVLGQTVPPESIQSSEIAAQPDGSYSLCFRDAAGALSLTLERFPSKESAVRIASLFRFDARRLEAGIDAEIDAALRADREFRPWFQVVAVVLVFPVMPLMLWAMPPESGNPYLHLASGLLATCFALFATRREDGVLGLSREEAYIDRWTLRGLFRRIEWRQFLGVSPSERILRVRPDPWIGIAIAVLAAQAGLILGLARINENSRRPHSEMIDAPDPEAVRRGGEMLEEFLRKRRKTEDVSLPDNQGQDQ